MLTAVSFVAVLSADGSTCTVLEVAEVGRAVVDINLVWWGWGEGNDDEGLTDVDGVFLDGWSEDTDGDNDGSNIADVIPRAVVDADDDTKTGAWETSPIDVTEWRLSETPAKKFKCENFEQHTCKSIQRGQLESVIIIYLELLFNWDLVPDFD